MQKTELEIASLLKQINLREGLLIKIGTVESATGGKVADRITNVPGSSEYFLGSIIAYSNIIKTKLLGVRSLTLERYGPVSSNTAKEMASGGRLALRVDFCVATTGIAGPGGGNTKKPVGLFYVAVAAPSSVTVKKLLLHGTRSQNKSLAAEEALALLKKQLSIYKTNTSTNILLK